MSVYELNKHVELETAPDGVVIYDVLNDINILIKRGEMADFLCAFVRLSIAPSDAAVLQNVIRLVYRYDEHSQD